MSDSLTHLAVMGLGVDGSLGPGGSLNNAHVFITIVNSKVEYRQSLQT